MHVCVPRVKRTTKVTIYQPSNIVDNSRLKRLTHKSSLILSTACQRKRHIFRTRINYSSPRPNRVAATMRDTSVSPPPPPPSSPAPPPSAFPCDIKAAPCASVAIRIVKVSSSRRDECGSRRAAAPASPRPGIMDAFHFR